MKAISWLLENRLLVLLATLLLTAGGVVAWRALPIDAFPDVTNTQVMVLAKAPGLAAVDVEERVSFPIEQAMRGLPRVRQVRSLSKAGLSQASGRSSSTRWRARAIPRWSCAPSRTGWWRPCSSRWPA
jgi:cobalt-zinc-cadmium resistance protein CzcA